MNLTSALEFVEKKIAVRHSSIFKSLLVLLLPLMAACSGNDDYELYSTISGYVADYDTAAPISDATITLSPGGLTARTDAAGNFSFTNLDAQQYTLTVQKSGYQPNRKTVIAVSGEEVEVSITLTQIPL